MPSSICYVLSKAFLSQTWPHFYFQSLYYPSIVAQTAGALSGLCHGWRVSLGLLKTDTRAHTHTNTTSSVSDSSLAAQG